MADIVLNTLEIHGDKAVLEELKKRLVNKKIKSDFSLEKIIQTPKELLDASTGEEKANNQKRFGYPTWYEFRIAMWGTKWDTMDAKVRTFDKDLLAYEFDTANNSPATAIVALSKDYPTLLFDLFSDFVAEMDEDEYEDEDDNPDSSDPPEYEHHIQLRDGQVLLDTHEDLDTSQN